jgi:hypothetical protein
MYPVAHLLNVIVEATDGKAGVVIILPNPFWVLLGKSRPGLRPGRQESWAQPRMGPAASRAW